MWQAFIYLNWPAQAGQRGVPNPNGRFGARERPCGRPTRPSSRPSCRAPRTGAVEQPLSGYGEGSPAASHVGWRRSARCRECRGRGIRHLTDRGAAGLTTSTATVYEGVKDEYEHAERALQRTTQAPARPRRLRGKYGRRAEAKAAWKILPGGGRSAASNVRRLTRRRAGHGRPSASGAPACAGRVGDVLSGRQCAGARTRREATLHVLQGAVLAADVPDRRPTTCRTRTRDRSCRSTRTIRRPKSVNKYMQGQIRPTAQRRRGQYYALRQRAVAAQPVDTRSCQCR